MVYLSRDANNLKDLIMPNAFELEVANLLNEYRIDHGRKPLEFNAKLFEAAENHSEDMAVNDFFSHTGSDGSRFWNRYDDVGYEWQTGGENIAAGQDTPQQVMKAWINSPGHRANMLNTKIEDVGIGFVQDTDGVGYGEYWTMDLGAELV